MRRRAAAVSSEPVADAAANEHLAGGGTALGAVLAGVFASGGHEPGVLLGPVSILLAGVGQGARAFDGRVRQPGLGIKRPRGFAPEQAIPDAARVGAPTALSAMLVALAYGGGGLRGVLRYGISAAERAGAPERARLLERVAQVGASALAEAAYRRGILRVGSASEGGLVTPRDLDPAADIDVLAADQIEDEGRWVVPPWSAADLAVTASQDARGAAVAAIDAQGVLAAAAYQVALRGVWIEELEMFAPLAAIPVLRGVPRVAPGVRLAAPAPIAVRWDANEGPLEVLMEPHAATLKPRAAASTRWIVRRNPTTRLVEVQRT